MGHRKKLFINQPSPRKQPLSAFTLSAVPRQQPEQDQQNYKVYYSVYEDTKDSEQPDATDDGLVGVAIQGYDRYAT